MTREHIALQLLKGEPMTVEAFGFATGWKISRDQCRAFLDDLKNKGLLMASTRTGPKTYEVREAA